MAASRRPAKPLAKSDQTANPMTPRLVMTQMRQVFSDVLTPPVAELTFSRATGSFESPPPPQHR